MNRTYCLAFFSCLCVEMAPALAQEAQEQQVPAQRAVAQDGKAQDSDWIVMRSDQTSSISVRLDSLVADTLYVSAINYARNRYNYAREPVRRVQSLPIGSIEKIKYSPSSSALWFGLGGGVLGAALTNVIVPDPNTKQNGYLLLGALSGTFCGTLIGVAKDLLSQDIYDLTKKTTAEKALLITDLLVSGASSRK